MDKQKCDHHESLQKENGGILKKLLRYPQRKTPPVSEQEVTLIAELGIEGDWHADGSERQIALLTVQLKEWMQKQEIKGICFQKYKENILLDGFDLSKCETGDLLVCGEAVLEISGCRKRCIPDMCERASRKEKCQMVDGIRFARVIKGGVIRKGMQMDLCKRSSCKNE